MERKNNGKELSMLDNTVVTEETDAVTLQSLSELTGFPIEMIKAELFAGVENVDSLQLKDLRTAMLSYIDKTMLVEKEN
jgi:hypothetical protein